MSVLTARHLSKTFQSRRVVRNVCVDVREGEVVGLLGPNGAGKTTSFHMIVGLVAVDEGRIELCGADITRLPIDARAALGLGYLPQESSVFRKLTVADNLRAVLEIVPGLTPHQREIRMQNLLEQFHIDHIADRLGETLSGGERRRTEIARALATRPRFILLDEPFAGVDPISVLDLQVTIEQLSKLGIGVLVTDHNVRDTLKICHRAYIVNEGSIIAEGTPKAILDNEQVQKVYLGSRFRL
ncbi:MAG: LPS export ABC transporter ATP-binding protein [Pseudomonadota bacterium]|nr:LPS export ABC transporter ATP-binding protein [Pseudomonadota bacterium]